ncbi:MAG TPA: YcnI family protein [Acidimicrobiia bacterium]|nr:YcnI family protein [Acidimicrobiia bacterium]
MKKWLAGAGAFALLFVLASPVGAHVTVSTDNPEPGGFAVYTVRVPNESDTASTIRVEVQIPEGLAASRYEPLAGWSLSLEEGVLVAEGGAIAPGEFVEFRFQARNPDAPGELAFPALQTYDDGEVVEWTGPPDADTPASTVEVGGADGSSGGPDAWSITALSLGLVGTVVGAVALVRGSR